MPSGRTFALAVIGFIMTVFTLGYIPILLKGLVSGSAIPGLVAELPYFDTNILLGIAAVAGAFTFAEKMLSENNPRLGGFYGIIRYIVSIYYTLTVFGMMGTIIIPAVNVTIQVAYLFLGTLIILGIMLNMVAFMIKIIAPKEFEKKQKTAKSKSTYKKETIAS
jgi:hypothetical protein